MLPKRKLPLRSGSGWKEIPPRETAWRIAWEGGDRIFAADTAFQQVIDGGSPGAVEGPLAYDAESRRLFRYYCPSLTQRNQQNGLLSVDPVSGNREMYFPLHPLRTLPWLLRKVPGRPLLVALVITDSSRPDRPGIVLRHQLGLFHLKEKKSLFRDLPAGCQHPVAASPETDRLLFHGPDGYQLVNLKGHRQFLLSDAAWGDGRRGGAFHPASKTLAIGGFRISLYNPAERSRKELPTDGCAPAWSPCGQKLFFSHSSSDLHSLDIATGKQEEILSIPANRYPELKKARPAELSPEGRYFALPITRRAPLHAESQRPGQPSWSEHQSLVIGDLNRKEFWQQPGPVDSCTWIGEARPEIYAPA